MDDLPEYVKQFFTENMRSDAMPDFEVPPKVHRWLTRQYKKSESRKSESSNLHADIA